MIFRSPCLNQPHPPHIPPPFPLRGKARVTILLLSRWKLLIRGLYDLSLISPHVAHPSSSKSSVLPTSGWSFPHVGGPVSTTPHLSNLNSLVGSQVQHDCLRESFPKRKSGPSATYSVPFFPPIAFHHNWWLYLFCGYLFKDHHTQWRFTSVK